MIPLAVALTLAGVCGCARVKPWQRERLATAVMAVPANPSPLVVGYQAKLLESRTAGGIPGVAAGGGCGCTQ